MDSCRSPREWLTSIARVPDYPFSMWRWRLKDQIGRRFTSWHMTETDALAKDPQAERVPGTEMVIDGPSKPTSIPDTGWGLSRRKD